MVDCRKCKNLFLKKTSEFTSMHACKLGMLPEVSVGRVEMPTECSGYEDIVEGKKYDTGKNRMGLVLQGFANALWEVGRVGTFGGQKYDFGNWQYLENAKERYFDALFRHLFLYMQGEEIDKESGLKHLSHALWNLTAVLEFIVREEKDLKEGNIDN